MTHYAERARVSVRVPDGWQEVGHLTEAFSYLEEDLEPYLWPIDTAVKRLALTFSRVELDFGKWYTLLTGLPLPSSGPPPIQPGMVTWPTRRKRRRRKA